MSFIELINSQGKPFLFDSESGWEILDRGDDPACWVNHREGRNMDSTQSYVVVKAKLLNADKKKLLQEFVGLAMPAVIGKLNGTVTYDEGGCTYSMIAKVSIDIATAQLAALRKVQP